MSKMEGGGGGGWEGGGDERPGAGADLEGEKGRSAGFGLAQVSGQADSECGNGTQQSERHRQHMHLCIAVLAQRHWLARCGRTAHTISWSSPMQTCQCECMSVSVFQVRMINEGFA